MDWYLRGTTPTTPTLLQAKRPTACGDNAADSQRQRSGVGGSEFPRAGTASRSGVGGACAVHWRVRCTGCGRIGLHAPSDSVDAGDSSAHDVAMSETPSAPDLTIAEQLRYLAVPIDSLVPDPANARTHDEKNMGAIKASLVAYGQRTPIVVQRQGMIVRAGIAAVVIDDDNATAMQFAIADNRTAELAEWDEATLAKLLSTMDADTQKLLAFTEKDLREMDSRNATEAVEDEPIDPPTNPVTKVGDMIELGRHRVLCGDATVKENVDRLLGSARPFLMVTDPPYGVDYDPEWRVDAGLNTDKARSGKVLNDHTASWAAAYLLFAGDVAYVWHSGGGQAVGVGVDLHASDLLIRGQIIWRKDRFAIGRGAYHWGHESCWYAVRKGASAKWCGDRSQSTVWDIKRPQVGEGGEDTITNHGTQKPVECMARPIRNHGGPGDAVYDPFLGSGTTLIACEQIGRQCFGLELDPGYCDVIVQRWERLTGLKAKRS
jgi:DNA modification methylase